MVALHQGAVGKLDHSPTAEVTPAQPTELRSHSFFTLQSMWYRCISLLLLALSRTSHFQSCPARSSCKASTPITVSRCTPARTMSGRHLQPSLGWRFPPKSVPFCHHIGEHAEITVDEQEVLIEMESGSAVLQIPGLTRPIRRSNPPPFWKGSGFIFSLASRSASRTTSRCCPLYPCSSLPCRRATFDVRLRRACSRVCFLRGPLVH